jgi:voltage-gated potassium channel
MEQMTRLLPCPDRAKEAATRHEALMSGLAIAFLVLTAVALHHFERTPTDLEQGQLLGSLMAAVWLPIFVESLIYYSRRGDYSWQTSLKLVLIWLVPPYRLALSTYVTGSCVWLPGLGWQRPDKDCFELLERVLSVPMLLVALMILPILAVEFLWAGYVAAYPSLALALDLGTAVIWLAFAGEFVVMSALAENKLLYIAKHWINLAIILLPFLAFLRGFQMVRLLRLGKATKALKVYRLRGLGLRAWQGLVALELVERVLHRTPEARVRHLRHRLAEKEREAELLRNRIQELEADMDDPDQ